MGHPVACIRDKQITGNMTRRLPPWTTSNDKMTRSFAHTASGYLKRCPGSRLTVWKTIQTQRLIPSRRLYFCTRSSMADRVFYWGSGSFPCWRAMVVLEEKKLEYDSKLITFSEGGHKKPEVLAINPRGQVPAFKDGDVIVNQSLAIMQYLEDFYPEPALMPKDKAAKGNALQMLHEVTVLADAMVTCLISMLRHNDEDMFNKAVEPLKKEIPTWEKHLEGKKFLTGSNFTLADAALGTALLTSMRFGATFKDYPNIKAYVERLKERPSFVKSYPPHWKEGPGKEYFTPHF